MYGRGKVQRDYYLNEGYTLIKSDAIARHISQCVIYEDQLVGKSMKSEKLISKNKKG